MERMWQHICGTLLPAKSHVSIGREHSADLTVQAQSKLPSYSTEVVV